mmetsp:Transcript_4276/g.10347  ORF Transcript_4276/g.10347 Transcript_4276/m.10347 type:complete len:200 (-) Transcript_4276:624-1223(-)
MPGLPGSGLLFEVRDAAVEVVLVRPAGPDASEERVKGGVVAPVGEVDPADKGGDAAHPVARVVVAHDALLVVGVDGLEDGVELAPRPLRLETADRGPREESVGLLIVGPHYAPNVPALLQERQAPSNARRVIPYQDADNDTLTGFAYQQVPKRRVLFWPNKMYGRKQAPTGDVNEFLCGLDGLQCVSPAGVGMVNCASC